MSLRRDPSKIDICAQPQLWVKAENVCDGLNFYIFAFWGGPGGPPLSCNSPRTAILVFTSGMETSRIHEYDQRGVIGMKFIPTNGNQSLLINIGNVTWVQGWHWFIDSWQTRRTLLNWQIAESISVTRIPIRNRVWYIITWYNMELLLGLSLYQRLISSNVGEWSVNPACRVITLREIFRIGFSAWT